MMATYNNTNSHPLPTAPVGGASMQPPHQPQMSHHARRDSQGSRNKSRTFSLRSDRSHKSGSTSHKIDPETHAEKEARRVHSKADPSMAINEAEPSALAATEKSHLASLRSMTHKDSLGNPISEPDKSNPTRYRWERPLDTIRSFEAAIDGGYNNRKSSYPSDNESNANYSRRNSYFNGNNARFPQDSYYGRTQSYMPTSNSTYDLRQGLNGRDTYYDQGGYNNGGGAYGQPGPRRPYSRIASESQIHGYLGQPSNSNHNVYPMPNNHRSYETVASGSGSGTSGEPAGYQTDPTSSDNSSIERRQSPAKALQMQAQQSQQPVNDYGIGFSQGASLDPTYPAAAGGYGSSPKQGMPTIQLTAPQSQQQPQPYQQSYQHQPYQQQQQSYPQQQQAAGAPPMASGKNVLTRKPTRDAAAPAAGTLGAGAAADKRKSWFSKRFSKN